MTVTYILIFILLSHIIIFRKMIFRWNVFGVFFITTMIFSIIGVMAFPFMKEYTMMTFNTFKLEMLTERDIMKTQIIGVSGVLLVLYSYVFGLVAMYKKVQVIDHFRIDDAIKDNLSKVNFYFMLISIFLFLILYLFIKRDLLIIGITEGFINRRPEFLLTARRGMTSNYLYVVITYNLLPFLTAVSLFYSMKKEKPIK